MSSTIISSFKFHIQQKFLMTGTHERNGNLTNQQTPNTNYVTLAYIKQ